MSGEVPEVRPIEDKTTYSVFQTSIAKLQTTRWRVNMNWQRHTADQAKEFLKGAPVRDKRALSEKGIFRMLFVHLPDSDRATLREDLIEAAVAYGWADSQLSCRLRSKTGGLLWSHTRDGARSGTCFVAQTPVADNNLTYYLSLTEVTHTYNAQSDWVCLFIGTNEASPERIASLVARDPFPSDFLPPLSPDFAFFPVCILSYDVSELAKGVDELNRRILDQAAYLAQTDDAAMEEGDDASGKPGGDVEMRLVDSYRPVTPDLRRIRASRSALLAVQQQHLMLKRRWAFLNDFTQTLVVYFGLREASMSNEGDPAFYSSTLRKKVDRELANLASLSHELRSIPLRIEAQQTSTTTQVFL
ncbi:hypothetical protein QBC34DRAFT_51173 [Podospora aff. communis PSN243]|uniref:Uncharacterized protein n=1 Tax=Podospora aff. communis PSN243 TaxID=3040156 RepID=A0AAV9GUH9_9PEZI|nr:hypothetical protein QBC34DRAFT_51173 [Podospora aff. communis PSN243]